MHQRKSKKVLIYFFLLILVGSVNNINLSAIEFYKVKKIEIFGLENKSKLLKKIENLDLRTIFFINIEDLIKTIESDNLIEDYKVIKKYPSTLNIYVNQTKFLGEINKDGKIYLIGSNGKLSKKRFSNEKLPFIFGNPSIDEFLKFKTIIDNSKFSYKQIKNLYFFPSKRWDVQLSNNILLKLPVSNIDETLDYLFELMSEEKPNTSKIIDARINNQIIFNE